MKFLLTLAALVTTALAASVAKPPPSVLSYSGPPTKEMHQIREEALADLKNGTQHLVARDSFGSGASTFLSHPAGLDSDAILG